MSETKDVRLDRLGEPAQGQTLSTKLLLAVAKQIEKAGLGDPTIEVIEIIEFAMLEAERRILAALETSETKDVRVKARVLAVFGGEVSDYKVGEVVNVIRIYDDKCTVEDERGYRCIVNVPLNRLDFSDLARAGAVDVGELVAALEPFAGETMPSLRRTVRDYDRNGLRRMMSPMEIAMRRAFQALAAYKRSTTDGQS